MGVRDDLIDKLGLTKQEFSSLWPWALSLKCFTKAGAVKGPCQSVFAAVSERKPLNISSTTVSYTHCAS